RHPVEVIDDSFLKYVAKCVESDEATLLSRNFVPELKFYVTFCYRPPKEVKTKQGIVERTVTKIIDTITNQAARQSVSCHRKNVATLVQRAHGYAAQLGMCGMTARAISATEYFHLLYRDLNTRQTPMPEAQLPSPARPQQAPLPPSLRRLF